MARRLATTPAPASTGKTTDMDLVTFAEFAQRAGEHSVSARIYESLAAKPDTAVFQTQYELWCSAAENWLIANKDDSALASARQCIAIGATAKGSEPSVGYAHRVVGWILLQRGVYMDAVEHARLP